ncbi:MAG: hypothetical protein M0R74_20035 [Dehalococcoidia bacterium]|nr:hypothetical protein [Dehalococcoidia bacterium]
MSRKLILTFVAVLGAILGIIGSEFGLALNGPAAAAGLGSVLLYVFFEAKADKARLRAQKDKFRDPKFYLALISAILAALVQAGIALPVSPEIIIAVLTAIMGVLFKTQDPKTA